MKNKFYFALLLSCFLVLSINASAQNEDEQEEQSGPANSRKNQTGNAAKTMGQKSALTTTDTSWTWLAAQWYTVSGNAINKSNWLESPNNSLAYNAQAQLFLYYQNKNRRVKWENQVETGLAYSQNNTDLPGVYTGDKVFGLTKLSYQVSKKSKFSYAALLSVNTSYRDVVDAKGNVKSGFFTPGTMEYGLGINYLKTVKKDRFSIFVSPTTFKTIYVLGNEDVYRQLKLKEKIKGNADTYQEFGTLVNASVLYNITPKIAYQANLDLYSDYLHKPENVFINSRNTFRFSFTSNFALSWALNIVYDDHLFAGPQVLSQLGFTLSPKTLKSWPKPKAKPISKK